ncbi:hypothetical protein EVAR_63014_1 [Eumeta japonica]|uniref:Uncharacterized protein n=1 Tax=Eumeta variegata TaxID=151549 RepID=A0A4C1YVQ3_EUMVA|nr:hypothetical protein EVAR_63014_1 [Eumeta japonica]
MFNNCCDESESMFVSACTDPQQLSLRRALDKIRRPAQIRPYVSDDIFITSGLSLVKRHLSHCCVRFFKANAGSHHYPVECLYDITISLTSSPPPSYSSSPTPASPLRANSTVFLFRRNEIDENSQIESNGPGWPNREDKQGKSSLRSEAVPNKLLVTHERPQHSISYRVEGKSERKSKRVPCRNCDDKSLIRPILPNYLLIQIFLGSFSNEMTSIFSRFEYYPAYAAVVEIRSPAPTETKKLWTDVSQLLGRKKPDTTLNGIVFKLTTTQIRPFDNCQRPNPHRTAPKEERPRSLIAADLQRTHRPPQREGLRLPPPLLPTITFISLF